MSNASLIRRLSRKTITLPNATRDARASGDLGPDEDVTITIRKVRVGEVTSIVGTPPRLLALASERREGETKEEQRERIHAAMMEDPDLVETTFKQQQDTTRAVVKLGVIDPPVELDRSDNPDVLTPEDFGDDLELIHDAIVTFSSLPYTALGVGGTETFPGEPVADRDQPDGAQVRVQTERIVEIEPG